METYSYEWEWRTQTSLPPPQRTFGSNNGGWAGAKSLYASMINYASQDVSFVLRQMGPGDTIRIESKTDSSVWAQGVLAVAPVEYSGFFTFPVSSADGVGAPINNVVYTVTVSTGAEPASAVSVSDHLANICKLASGMLATGKNWGTVGVDSIQMYRDICISYLAEPDLPQPVPLPDIMDPVKKNESTC